VPLHRAVLRDGRFHISTDTLVQNIIVTGFLISTHVPLALNLRMKSHLRSWLKVPSVRLHCN